MTPQTRRDRPLRGRACARIGEPDLATLPIAGLTRRRMASLLGVALIAWVVILFARQVTDAAAATGRVEAMAAANQARAGRGRRAPRELELIQQPAFIDQEARGTASAVARVPFSLGAGARRCPRTHPVRRGAARCADLVSPLERWLTLLFGPGD